jgi:hypothetical protein
MTLRGRLGLAVAACALMIGAGTLSAAGEQAAAGKGGGKGGERTKELPRGGTSILPEYRPVAFDGAPQAEELGELGVGSPSGAARRLKRQARPYERIAGKEVYPTFELIATIALAGPGEDGKYRSRQSDATVRKYLKVARREKFLMLLDIQPGRSTFIDEVKHFAPFLRNRNVGIGLDPEWNMGDNGVPGERIGSVDAKMINRVSALMRDIVERHDLPDKVLLIHQFTPEMIRGEKRILRREGLDIVLNVDGFGSPEAKRGTYERLRPTNKDLSPGFKLFYKEDSDLMSPRQVLRLRPRPSVVVYE